MRITISLLLAAGVSIFVSRAAFAGETAPPPAPDAAPAAQAQPAPAAAVQASTEPAPGTSAPTLAVENLVDFAKQYDDENAPGITAQEKARRLAAKARIDGILDLREMAHQILIKKWDTLKPEQREKYAYLLPALVAKVGYPQISKYFNGAIEVKCVGEKPLENGNREVLTHIVYKEEDLTLNTEFRLHPTGKGWRIYDVVTDGESLLLIYRNQHMGIIKDKGFPELVRLMEKKLNETD
jgi:ABC-type transporter MlaC component